jgi:uncharacterized protein
MIHMSENGEFIVDMHHHLLNIPGYADAMVERAGALGIDHVCVSGLGLASDNWLGDLSPTNDDVLRTMERYPDTIVGFGVIRLGEDDPKRVRELHRQGFKGIKTTRPLHNYDDPVYDEVYAVVQELQMPMLFHTGFILNCKSDPVDNVSSARMRPVQLDRVARTFPKLVIIMAHLGMPWYEEAAQMTRFHANVYVDWTGSPKGWRNRKSPGFFSDLFYWDGAYEKVLFGTDVHCDDMRDALSDYRRILDLNNVDAAVQRKVFGETARAILRL